MTSNSTGFVNMELGACLELVIDHRGKTPRKLKSDWVESGIPTISAKNVNSGKLVATGAIRYVTHDVYKKWMSVDVARGDCFLVSEGATLGHCMYWDETYPIVLGQRIFCLRANPEILYSRYLYAYMNTIAFQSEIVGRATGSSVSGLRQTEVLKLNIKVPPMAVQKIIGDTLYNLNKKAEVNNQTNQTLEEMSQAIFKSWFVDFAPVKAKMNGEHPEGMDEATASLFPEKLVESELGLIPEGWDVDQVGNHIDVTKGKSYKSAELQESTTALVTLKSFKRGGGYRMDGLKEYTGKYKPQQVIEAGDLVMSLTDVTQAAEIVGKPALVIDAPQYDTLVASLDVAILRSKEADAKQYFYGLMSTYRFHRYAESFATGTTVLHLSPKGITTFEFACPSAELVKKYNDFSAPIFAKIEANILESQELAKLRDTLLPKLLSGEIDLDTTEELVEVN